MSTHFIEAVLVKDGDVYLWASSREPRIIFADKVQYVSEYDGFVHLHLEDSTVEKLYPSTIVTVLRGN